MSRMLLRSAVSEGDLIRGEEDALHLHLVLQQLDRMHDSLGTVCAVRVCEQQRQYEDGRAKLGATHKEEGVRDQRP